MDKEVFLREFEQLSTDTKVSLWNCYAIEEDADSEIYENDEYFFNEYFDSAYEAVRATYFGKYRFNDNYVWYNAYGNLESSDWADEMPIDPDILFDYLQEHPDDLESYCEDFPETLATVADDEDSDED